MDRRTFLKASANLVAVGVLGSLGLGCQDHSSQLSFELEPLPYAKDALEPYLSAETIAVHYGKHHRKYVENVNRLIASAGIKSGSLPEIIQNSPKGQKMYNNAAQAYNHSFYWQSMKPNSGKPEGDFKKALESTYGSLEKFKYLFYQSAVKNFGSGWTWLVSDHKRLKIINTSNAGTPITEDVIPLLTIDVWEHAYYLDYENRRGGYVRAYLDHLANWEFATKNYMIEQ